MSDNPGTPPVADRIHPRVWIALIGFVLWFVVAIWSFGVGGYVDWLLFVVTGFLSTVVTLALILSRVGRDPNDRVRGTFRDWAAGTFATWQGRPKALNAAAEMIMPIAAAAVGMTAFGIVYHYAAMHAPMFS